jgi:hypothetical protein
VESYWVTGQPQVPTVGSPKQQEPTVLTFSNSSFSRMAFIWET